MSDYFDSDADDAAGVPPASDTPDPEPAEEAAPEPVETEQVDPSEDPLSAASQEQELVTLTPTGEFDFVSVAIGEPIDLTQGNVELPADQAALVIETGAVLDPHGAEVAE